MFRLIHHNYSFFNCATERMYMEQGLYAQVIMLRRKYLKFVTTDKNKNEAKFKFQGLSARSQLWFDLDIDLET